MNKTKCRFGSLLLLLSGTLAVTAGKTNGLTREAAEATIEENKLRLHLTYLASDELEGRDTGSEGLRKAGRYIRDLVREFGLKPAGDQQPNGTLSFFQEVEVPQKKTTLAKGNSLRLFREGQSLNWDVETSFLPFSFSGNSDAKHKQIAFVGYGISNSEKNYDDYAGIDVADKIVVMFRYDPRESAGHFDTGNRDAWFNTKAQNAIDHGAAGMIIVNGPLSRRAGSDDPLFALTSIPPRSEKGPPMIHAKRDFLAKLLEPVGVDIRELQARLDQDQKPNSFLIPKTTVSVSVRLKREHVKGDNLIALLEGSDPALRDEYVVLGAHYDHVGLGYYGGRWGAKGRGQIHNGADDNGSGTVALIEVAQALSLLEQPPKRSVLFMFFCGEERGLAGSAHWVKKPTVPIDQMVAMVNADMIGRSDNGKITISGVGTSPGFSQMVTRHNRDIGLKIRLRDTGVAPSDNASFYRAGIPVLFYYTGSHAQYHTPDDDVEHINFSDHARITKHLFRTVLDLADRPDRPRYQKTTSGRKGVMLGIFSDPNEPRVRIQGFADRSAAKAAGLHVGDTIIELAGKNVGNLADLRAITSKMKPGTKSTIKVIRKINKPPRELIFTIQF